MANLFRFNEFLSFYGDGDGEGQGDGSGGNTPKTFTEEEYKKGIEQERKVNNDRNRKILEELEGLKKNSNLTSQERESLAKRVEELEGTLLTKEEQAEKERSKLEKKYTEDLDTLSKQKTFWESRYKDSTIKSDIASAAAAAKAVNPTQILALVQPNAQLVEEKSDEGEVLGFKVRIKVPVTKDGKTALLDLSPQEAIERMKEDESYQNLFQDTIKGGAGMGNSPPKNVKGLEGMSMEEYKALRSKHGPGAGFGRK